MQCCNKIYTLMVLCVLAQTTGCSLLMDDYERVDNVHHEDDDTSQDSGSDDQTGTESDIDTNGGTDTIPPPVFSVAGDAVAVEGQPITLEVIDASDGLLFSLEDAPDGALIDAETGLVTWTPAYSLADRETGETIVTIIIVATGTQTPAASTRVPHDITVLNDEDFDGSADQDDNCPLITNSSQFDYDTDGVGYACDAFIQMPADVAQVTGEGHVSLYGEGVSAMMAFIVSSDTDDRLLTLGNDGAYYVEADTDAALDFSTMNPHGFKDGSAWYDWSHTNGNTMVGRADGEFLDIPYEDGVTSMHAAPDGGVVVLLPDGSVDRWFGSTKTTLLLATVETQIIALEDDLYVVANDGEQTTVYYYQNDGSLAVLVEPAPNVIVVPLPASYNPSSPSRDLYVAIQPVESGYIRVESYLNGELQTTGGVHGIDIMDSIEFIPVQRQESSALDIRDDKNLLWLNINNTYVSPLKEAQNIGFDAHAVPAAVTGVYAAGLNMNYLTIGSDIYQMINNDAPVLVASDVDFGLLGADVSTSGVLGWVTVENNPPGNTANPRIVVAHQLVGDVLHSVTLPMEAVDLVTRSPKVAADGVLWGNIWSNDNPGDSYLYSFNRGTLTQHNAGNSIGGDIQLAKYADGYSMLYYEFLGDAKIYTAHNETLATAFSPTAGSISKFLFPETTLDNGYTWVAYASGVGYALASWKNGVATVVLDNLLSSGSAYRANIDGMRYYFYESAIGWSVATLSNGVATTLLSGLDVAPQWLMRPNDQPEMIVYAKNGEYFVAPVEGGVLGTPLWWSNKEISIDTLRGRDIGLLTIEIEAPNSAAAMSARCSTITDVFTCFDEPASDYVKHYLGYYEDMPIVILDVSVDTDTDYYLYRSINGVAPPPADCLQESSSPLCSSARINSCVCAKDDSCCKTAWSAACVALVAASPCTPQ